MRNADLHKVSGYAMSQNTILSAHKEANLLGDTEEATENVLGSNGQK